MSHRQGWDDVDVDDDDVGGAVGYCHPLEMRPDIGRTSPVHTLARFTRHFMVSLAGVNGVLFR